MKRAMTLIVALIASITKPGIGSEIDSRGDIDQVITAAGPGGGPHIILGPFSGVVDQGDGNWTFIGGAGPGGGPFIVVGAGAGGGPHIVTTRLEQLQCDTYVRTTQVEICTIMDDDGDIQRTGIAWICPAGQDCFFRDIDESIIVSPGIGGGPHILTGGGR